MSKVFSSLTPDPVGKILGTRFNQFTSITGIDGLCRDNGHGQLELLAVHAATRGKGQFRRFIKYLKYEYQTICVWHVENPLLDIVLPRYGFRREVMVDEFGETLTGWRWDLPKDSSCNNPQPVIQDNCRPAN